jgi:hypothetical protein
MPAGILTSVFNFIGHSDRFPAIRPGPTLRCVEVVQAPAPEKMSLAKSFSQGTRRRTRRRLFLDRWRGCAQTFHKRRLDRVGPGTLAASAQLLHQAADAQRTDAGKIVLDG